MTRDADDPGRDRPLRRDPPGRPVRHDWRHSLDSVITNATEQVLRTDRPLYVMVRPDGTPYWTSAEPRYNGNARPYLTVKARNVAVHAYTCPGCGRHTGQYHLSGCAHNGPPIRAGT